MKRIKFTLYHQILPEVEELSRSLTETLQSLTGTKETCKVSFPIGTIKVNLPDGQTVEELREDIQTHLRGEEGLEGVDLQYEGEVDAQTGNDTKD